MRTVRFGCLLLIAAFFAAPNAQAGSACQQREVGASELRKASVATLKVVAELEAHDRPFAIISRVGQDLSKFGLRYSHAALVVRDHPAGRWTVVHQLNYCGTAESGIYVEGLLNFFLDDLLLYEAHLIWPDDQLNTHLAAALEDGAVLGVFDSRYNVISRYGSSRTQNSTAWLVELIGSALAAAQPRCAHQSKPRKRAQCALDRSGFEADKLRIGYGQRLIGGLFSANAQFTDHPVGARLSGSYRVVTVRSVLDFLEARAVAQTVVAGGEL